MTNGARAEVVVDLDQPILMVAVGNGANVGGGTELTPHADPGDGKVDVWVSDTDGDGKPDLYQFDTDGDGKVDITMSDLDQDGNPEAVVDGDGGVPPA